MFDNAENEAFGTVIAISLFVYFALQAYAHLSSEAGPWVRTAIGIAAAVLAISALLALF